MLDMLRVPFRWKGITTAFAEGCHDTNMSSVLLRTVANQLQSFCFQIGHPIFITVEDFAYRITLTIGTNKRRICARFDEGSIRLGQRKITTSTSSCVKHLVDALLDELEAFETELSAQSELLSMS
jgi:hypothetical protein